MASGCHTCTGNISKTTVGYQHEPSLVKRFQCDEVCETRTMTFHFLIVELLSFAFYIVRLSSRITQQVKMLEPQNLFACELVHLGILMHIHCCST